MLDLGTTILLVMRDSKEDGTSEVADMDAYFRNSVAVRGVSGVASGFADIASASFDNVTKLLKQYNTSTSKPVWLMGHSLGGALSVVTANVLHVAGALPACVHIPARGPATHRGLFLYETVLQSMVMQTL